MAQMRGVMILKVCMENSSLGKLLASNEVQVNVFGADASGMGYDITRVKVWSNEVAAAVDELFKLWYSKKIRYSSRDEGAKNQCFKEILVTIMGSTLCKEATQKEDTSVKTSPLYRLDRWASELAQQMDNAYNLWTFSKESFDQKVASAKIKN